MERSPTLAQIRMVWALSNEGQASELSVLPTDDAELNECLGSVLGQIQFPRFVERSQRAQFTINIGTGEGPAITGPEPGASLPVLPTGPVVPLPRWVRSRRCRPWVGCAAASAAGDADRDGWRLRHGAASAAASRRAGHGHDAAARRRLRACRVRARRRCRRRLRACRYGHDAAASAAASGVPGTGTTPLPPPPPPGTPGTGTTPLPPPPPPGTPGTGRPPPPTTNPEEYRTSCRRCSARRGRALVAGRRLPWRSIADAPTIPAGLDARPRCGTGLRPRQPVHEPVPGQSRE